MLSEDWKSKVWAKCCVCGCPLTPLDYERGKMIVDEWEHPYTDEVEIRIYCSDCYNDLFPDEEAELEEMEWEDC
jgi:hypothetical protein